ncbi:TetR family transcriptional regulator [Mycobacterium sp. CBMA293]|uniref:TetR/AcrR family transcriptional regulator C-terminal domain-containing protein n=1 Tax=unclassified Mycolicibacterium TaxID=2636767 RepID=UPI001325FDD8|nr:MULTISPECIES: TetR/AcrR family transcriptional regulator C-terminal domain-containing protein [unclassified Mycolicibacterium]MUL45283.1 TetR family transcriptional regulator [Mycolicibacterium sp. CBMA 360]MUL91890.1 TetR family transcriptional regulator [Mycolicibacterium sp. CBMA 230]MUM34182.1 TetR family transcriptional regulator [Mycolicibacterium sp. CBMA 361]MUL56803.1 TetR family transcriptional regulator [Mycolicibacterium sp. CBMA 335]MUL69842.1 TetR family transcriptional regula
MQLHRSDVVAKAAEILDNYGIADLTMRRLARELSVSPGALYWHFADKQELLGAVADRLLASAAAVAVAGEWPERIVAICSALRDALLSATDGAELVSASFSAGRSAELGRIVDALAEACADSGLTADDAELAARTIVYYVLGFTADEQSRLQWDAAGATVADADTVWSENAGGRFAFGLDLLIDGLAAHAITPRP